jgi:hypothetical protein
MTPDVRRRVARRAATALGLVALFVCGASRAAGQSGAAPTPTPAQAPERLTLPGKDWALDLSLPGFVKIVDTPESEGRGRLLMAGPADKKKFQMLMVRLMPARRDGGGREFRDFVLASAKKAGAAEISGVKTFEYGELPLLKYKFNLSSVLGMPPNMSGGGMLVGPTHRLTAFLARDGVWVEITHLGGSSGEKEEKAFYAVLDTVKFVDTSAPSTSFDFFHKGQPHYRAGEYRKAVEYYRRALELERQGRRLEAAQWRELVEEAAWAYGSIGDVQAAQAVAEYGLAEEPDHAIFHFIMAVVHASRDDLDATIAALNKAFLNKARLPPGQRLPDPRTYAPFQRFSKDEEFRRATKNMKP